MSSHIIRKVSATAFFIDMNEHRSILKKKKEKEKSKHLAYYPRFRFTPETSKKLPETGHVLM